MSKHLRLVNAEYIEQLQKEEIQQVLQVLDKELFIDVYTAYSGSVRWMAQCLDKSEQEVEQLIQKYNLQTTQTTIETATNDLV